MGGYGRSIIRRESFVKTNSSRSDPHSYKSLFLCSSLKQGRTFYLIRGKLAAVEKLGAKEAEIFWSFTQAPGYGIRRTAQASGHHGSSSATLPVVDPCAAATGANHKRQPDLMLAMIIE